MTDKQKTALQSCLHQLEDVRNQVFSDETIDLVFRIEFKKKIDDLSMSLLKKTLEI